MCLNTGVNLRTQLEHWVVTPRVPIIHTPPSRLTLPLPVASDGAPVEGDDVARVYNREILPEVLPLYPECPIVGIRPSQHLLGLVRLLDELEVGTAPELAGAQAEEPVKQQEPSHREADDPDDPDDSDDPDDLDDLGDLGDLGDLDELGHLGHLGHPGGLGDRGNLGDLGDLGDFGELGDPGELDDFYVSEDLDDLSRGSR